MFRISLAYVQMSKATQYDTSANFYKIPAQRRRIQFINRFTNELKVLLKPFYCFENCKTVSEAVTLFRFTVFKTV